MLHVPARDILAIEPILNEAYHYAPGPQAKAALRVLTRAHEFLQQQPAAASWQLHTYEKWPTHMKLLYILVPSGFFPTAPSVGCLGVWPTYSTRMKTILLCPCRVCRATESEAGNFTSCTAKM